MEFYLVPKIGSGTFLDSFRPKYIGDFGTVNDPMVPPAVERPRWSGMDYGLDPTFLVGATLTPAQHTFVAAQSDAYVIPPLDAPVGGNPVLNQVRNRLEQQSIPGSWIEATTTNRTILGRVGRLCLISQRLHGRHNKRLFEPGVGLDSTPSQSLLDQLIDVGTSFGMDTSPLSLTVTMRFAILYLADQLPPFGLAGETF